MGRRSSRGVERSEGRRTSSLLSSIGELRWLAVLSAVFVSWSIIRQVGPSRSALRHTGAGGKGPGGSRGSGPPLRLGTIEPYLEQPAALQFSSLYDDEASRLNQWRTSRGLPVTSDGTLICHIAPACVLPDGTLMLHSWMRAHVDKLSHCGLGYPLYTIPNEPSGPDDVGYKDAGLRLGGYLAVDVLWPSVSAGAEVERAGEDMNRTLQERGALESARWETECFGGAAGEVVDCRGSEVVGLGNVVAATVLSDSADSAEVWQAREAVARRVLGDEVGSVDLESLFAKSDGSSAVCFRSWHTTGRPQNEVK